MTRRRGVMYAYAKHPRNVLARNWRRATLDITVNNPWRLAVRYRRWRFLNSEPKPMQRTIEVLVGPVAVASWIKSEPAPNGRSDR